MNLAAFHGWFSQHPETALLAVFLVATAESLAVVGLLVPGVAMMFAAGALVGTGSLSFWPICAAAVAGAVVGDGLSYWLGWHYRDRVGGLWPLSRHPGLVEQGVTFFRRHGGSSVLFGRFVGPIRAVIPLVAGMLAMPPRRFLMANLLSALLWGPAYLLPGMVFGASLELASAVAGRLAVVLLAFLALLWFTAWVSVRLYRYFQPRAHDFILATFYLSREHPLLGRLTAPLIDPWRRDYPGLLAWGAILAAVAVLGNLALAALGAAPAAEPWSHPLAQPAVELLESLAAPPAVFVFAVVLSLALVLAGLRIGAAHLLAGIAFALSVGGASALLFEAPAVDGPLLSGAVAYGFAAVLAADRAGAGRRWLAYPAAALLAAALAFARFYSGAAGLAALACTLALALAWLVPLGVAYRRHSHEDRVSALPAWLAPVILGGLAIHFWNAMPGEAERPRPAPATLTETDWLEAGWRQLPAKREGVLALRGQPLSIQWAAPLDRIGGVLEAAGWRRPVPLGFANALVFLQPNAGLAELPIPPHFRQADPDALRLIREGPDGRWLIVRFWPSGFLLEPGALPIWVGTVSFLEARGLPGLWTYADETGDPEEAAKWFAGEMPTRLPVLSSQTDEGRPVLLIPPASP